MIQVGQVRSQPIVWSMFNIQSDQYFTSPWVQIPITLGIPEEIPFKQADDRDDTARMSSSILARTTLKRNPQSRARVTRWERRHHQGTETVLMYRRSNKIPPIPP
ncbi:hypothetical protein WAI453_001403 [Rhynchosporium graminicola]